MAATRSSMATIGIPRRRPTEVVVRVKACALNGVDMLLLDGRFPPPEGLPHVNGCEVAGTVETLGAAAKGVSVGQRVIVFPGFSCGTCEFCLRGERTLCLRYGYLGAHKDGGYAERVKVLAGSCLPLHDSVSFEAGAALPLAFLTSWHALLVKAELKPGQTVLVQAAGSGIGSAAIQIARLIGARVADDRRQRRQRSSSPKRSAPSGSSTTAPRTSSKRRRSGRTSAGWTSSSSTSAARRSSDRPTRSPRLGTLVSIGSHDTHWGRLDLRHVYSKNLRILGTNLGSILELRTLLEYVVDGRLKPVIDRAFPLADARHAVQHVLDRKNKGKVLLVPR